MPQKKEKGKRTFEEALARLEEIVESLDEGEVPLEKAIDLYEEGMSLSRECVDTLSKVELRLKKLVKDAGGRLDVADAEEPES